MLDHGEDAESYYSTNVAYYDYLFHDHLRSSEALLESVLSTPQLQNTPVTSVLDACCGSGHNVEFLLRRGFQVDASDLCQEMLDYARVRVSRLGLTGHFFQADVLEIGDKTKTLYDLVLFRGNTLAHLSPADQLRAVQQLYDRTKPGKFLLLDFRDGRRYHREKKRFELRGYGIDAPNHVVFISFYGVKPARVFSGTYRLKSRVMVFNYRDFKFSMKSQRIEGYYVNVEAILERLSELGCSFDFIEGDGRGLPYLKTVLVTKSQEP